MNGTIILEESDIAGSLLALSLKKSWRYAEGFEAPVRMFTLNGTVIKSSNILSGRLIICVGYNIQVNQYTCSQLCRSNCT